MAVDSARLRRLVREEEMLAVDPPFGVYCARDGDRVDVFVAQIMGPEGTPYAEGTFRLELTVPPRYPFEPPVVRFVTPVYHPNVDTAGRICLDVLKMPPKGAWKPSLNIPIVLTSIQQLLGEPNPDDALMHDIAAQFRDARADFDRAAREHTRRHAVDIVPPTVPALSAPSYGSASPMLTAAASAASMPLMPSIPSPSIPLMPSATPTPSMPSMPSTIASAFSSTSSGSGDSGPATKRPAADPPADTASDTSLAAAGSHDPESAAANAAASAAAAGAGGGNRLKLAKRRIVLPPLAASTDSPIDESL